MKSVFKSLILILTGLVVIFAFQNCQKLKTMGNDQSGDCAAVGINNDCYIVSKNGTPIAAPVPANSEISINSYTESAFYRPIYKITMSNETVVNTKTNMSCSVAANNNWQIIKNSYLQKGLCKYNYYLPPDMVRCLAASIPMAYVKDINDLTGEIAISGGICQHDHVTICGSENQEEFHKAIIDLSKELDANSACLVVD